MTAEMLSIKAGRKTPVWTAFDEWNIINAWADGGKRDDVHKFEANYNLRDALWVAGALNALLRNCRTVRLANLAQLVNVIAPMQTMPTGLLLKTIYYPLELYANRSGGVVLDVLAESPRFISHRWGELPYLDVMASFDEAKRRVRVALVNRRKEGEVVASLGLEDAQVKAGSSRAFVISGVSPDAENTFERPDAVKTREAR